MARPATIWTGANPELFEENQITLDTNAKIAFYKDKVEEYKDSYIKDISTF